MQILATAEQMRSFDRQAINGLSIPGIVLMENAGRSFVEIIARQLGPWNDKRVFVLCGKGNNGGDGFVIARHLLNCGARVHTFLIGRKREVKGDARKNLDVLVGLSRTAPDRVSFDEFSTIKTLTKREKPDVIVDALLGTGFAGRVEGNLKKIISWMNESGARVASVDIASGVDSTSGIVASLAVTADATVAMGLAKTGQFVGRGRDHSGIVTTADIGIPGFVFRQAKDQTYRVLREDISKSLPSRPITAHKHSVGKVFVLSGSRGYTGAPFLCSQAVMRVGAGTVILGVPRSIHGIMARKVSEVMVSPLDETEEGTVSKKALSAAEEHISWSDVVVIGPGLSRNPETVELLRSLIPEIQKPLVLDADGLNALSAQKSLLRKRRYPAIVTPHAGELSRIIGEPSGLIEDHRVRIARESAKSLRSILVLKGAPTATATLGGSVYLNSTGNPGMATAGSGDVLAGMIAGLLAQGTGAEAAAYVGVFLHGLAGDIAAKEVGERSLLAHDILDCIPRALALVEKGGGAAI